MTRRYRNNDNPVVSIVVLIVIFYFVYVIFLYQTNRVEYWHQLWYFVAFLIVIAVTFVSSLKLCDYWREKKLNNILMLIKNNNLEDYIINFIDRWGMQKGKKGDWTYRGHSFDWERLSDFRKVLNEKGMHLSTEKWDSTNIILKYFIQEKEERLTRESISILPKKFSELSGYDFESLLYRLFSNIGYAVQRTGKVGDQGADLIANLNGQRIVIQAKCYIGNVGNSAVQEAIAAQKFYNCNKAMAVTNSSFTREAIDLAKVSNVELIDGKKLSELLQHNLKESWS
jgi:HJR/Mrr/RecB family endonuclease